MHTSAKGLIRPGLRLFLFLALALVSSEGWAGHISLHPIVMRELNQVIRASGSLHAALVSEDDEQLEISVRDVIRQIDRVRTVAIHAKQHERSHLLRIVEGARDRLESAQTAFGEERRGQFLQAYQQIVNIVRIYNVDKAYSIFFCDKDKSSWVQKGTVAQDPFTPAFRKCGIRIPK